MSAKSISVDNCSCHVFFRRAPHGWWAILLAALILMSLGCGSKPQETALDPLALFADHQTSASRHHPYDFVELDLGEFDVAIPIKDSVDQYRIGFKAAAIAPKSTAEKLKPLLEEYQTRIRDMILVSAQTLSANNITDPHQAWLKSEIIGNLSKMLKTREIRDVVFSNYNFERR
jgi:hypothetical protein